MTWHSFLLVPLLVGVVCMHPIGEGWKTSDQWLLCIVYTFHKEQLMQV